MNTGVKLFEVDWILRCSFRHCKIHLYFFHRNDKQVDTNVYWIKCHNQDQLSGSDKDSSFVRLLLLHSVRHRRRLARVDFVVQRKELLKLPIELLWYQKNSRTNCTKWNVPNWLNKKEFHRKWEEEKQMEFFLPRTNSNVWSQSTTTIFSNK